jgi:L-iditol 2-dehydrogenase
MLKMKAVVLRSPYRLEIEELPIPEPSDSEALIKVKAVSICATDLEIYRGTIPVSYPLVLGHEIAGEVVEIGRNVTKVRKGEKVVIKPGGIIGRTRNGGFAEYVVVPESLLFKLPENLSYEEGALVELLWTVYHGHKRAGIGVGDSVAILGLGAAGILHLMLAKMAGASPLIGVDIVEDKLKLGKVLGADYVINSKEEDPKGSIMKITNNKGVDVVIEAAGVPQTVKLSLDIARYGGRILLFGIITDPIREFNAYPIYEKELTLIGSRAMLESEYEPLYTMLSRSKLDLKPLISAKIPLEKLPETFEQLNKRQLNVIRIVVTP